MCSIRVFEVVIILYRTSYNGHFETNNLYSILLVLSMVKMSACWLVLIMEVLLYFREFANKMYSSPIVDVQTCSAITEEEGLYEGLDWLQCQVTSNDVKETVIAPVKDSVIPPLSRIRNSLTNIRNYLWPSPAETSS